MDFRTIEIITALAVLLSPVIAVGVTLWYQGRKERRGSKFWVFNTLIGARHSPLSDQNLRALNLIDVVFHDDGDVRRLWHEYYDMLNNAGLNNPAGFATRQKKNLEMLTKMAATLGYKATITHLDVDRVYYPVALAEQAARNQELSELGPRFFRSLNELLAKQGRPADHHQAAPPAAAGQ